LLIRDGPVRQAAETRAILSLAFFAAVIFATFLLAPGSLAAKTHLVLHGVCAQRPSHSLQFAGVPLPLDARMTGLYTGSVVAFLWLVVLGRNRVGAPLSRILVAALAVFVILLVVDGTNALLFDLELPHPYSPSNTLRLITGLLAGTSLGVVLGRLFGRTLWSPFQFEGTTARSVVEIVPALLISATLGALALSGLPVLFGPIAVGLLLAVVGLFAVLAMIILATGTSRAHCGDSWSRLAPLAAGSLLVAVTMIAALGAFRVFVERTMGFPPLT
jgi:uncharacterized membrane protein